MRVHSYIIICLVISTFYSIRVSGNNNDSKTNQISKTNKTLEDYELKCNEYRDVNFDSVIRYAEDGLRISIEHKNRLMEAKFREHLGFTYVRMHKYDSAHVHLLSSLEIATKIKDKRQKANSYRVIGGMHSDTKQYTLALDHFLKALDLYEELGDDFYRMATLNNIASMHRMCHNIPRAMTYLNQAMELAEKLEDPRGKMQVYYNAGVLYFLKKEQDIGREYTLISLNLSRHLSNKVYELSCLKLLAVMYSNLGDYESAIYYSDLALAISTEMDDATEITWALLAKSNAYSMLEYWKEAEATAMKAWELDTVKKMTLGNIIYNIALSNIHLGNKEKAIKFLGKYSENEKMDSGLRYESELAAMEIKYETEKKEMKIALLEKDNAIYTYLIIASIAIALLSLGLLFIRNRLNINKRKLADQKIRELEHEKKLVATQSILEGETSERTRLAKDLHDGLGGMLSVVKLNLKTMAGKQEINEESEVFFGNAMNMLDQSIVELRRVSHHMMPESLINYGLKVSLEDFCRATPGIHFFFIGEEIRLPQQMEIILYRCAYELVNNAIRHAQATNIKVQLVIENRLIALTVQDNGIGFDPDSVTLGNGLKNIFTRISAYNGKAHIYSKPDSGSEISIEIEAL